MILHQQIYTYTSSSLSSFHPQLPNIATISELDQKLMDPKSSIMLISQPWVDQGVQNTLPCI